MKKEKKYICLIITLLVLFDQVIKLLVLKTIDVNNAIIIIDDFLKFTFIKNTGAAFGIFGNMTSLLVILTIFLLYYLITEIRKNMDSKLKVGSLILIVSGALGNLIDRLFRGYVIDFISFTLFGKEMAIFNLADIFITFGVILLMYIIMKEGKNGKNSCRRKR